MIVLIIEDDEFKSKRIAKVVRDYDETIEVLIERSVNSGLRAIITTQPDLILLDMSLTTFDIGPNEGGGRPQNFGGMEVLRQLDRLDVKVPVIVITQHDKFLSESQEMHLDALRKELMEEHKINFRGLIYYRSAEGGWERQLSALIAGKPTESERRNGRKSPRRRR